MKTLFLTALLLIACGQDDQKTEKATESKWTVDEVQNMKNSCASGLNAEYGDLFTYYEAYIYCGCVAEEAAKRWTFEEYLLHEIEYTNILEAEGHIDRCVKIAKRIEE